MNIIAGGFYDSVMLYAQVLNETMTPAGDRPPGKLVNDRMWNRIFHGQLGNNGFWNRSILEGRECGARTLMSFGRSLTNIRCIDSGTLGT